MATGSGDKLWRYADVARGWSWLLIAVAALLALLAVGMEAGSEGGLGRGWILTMLGVALASGLVLFPALRLWLGRGGLPSARLGDANRPSNRRLLEASPRDWRRWLLVTGLLMLVGTAAMMVFLVAVLGRGGIAEGVTVGTLVAWAAVTLEDVRRIHSAEEREGRRYFAACRRPAGVGNHLVWLRANDA